MEHAKKMVLVPAEDDDLWKEPMIGGGTRVPGVAPATVQTPGDSVSRLDADLSEILRSNKYRDDAEKWKQYLQVLQRYLFLVEARKGPLDPSLPGVATAEALRDQQRKPPVNETFNDTAIMDSIPAMYKRKAQVLVKYLRTSQSAAQRIRWDHEGRVTIDGVLVPNSNIVDLINDAVRSRKNFKANGQRQFIQSLRDIAVPREFIGNDKLWELGDKVSGVKRKRNNPGNGNEEIAHYSDDDEEETDNASEIEKEEEKHPAGKSFVTSTPNSSGSMGRAHREELFNARRGLNYDFTLKKTKTKEKSKKKKQTTTPKDSEVIVRQASKRLATANDITRAHQPIVIPHGFDHWLKI